MAWIKTQIMMRCPGERRAGPTWAGFQVSNFTGPRGIAKAFFEHKKIQEAHVPKGCKIEQITIYSIELDL